MSSKFSANQELPAATMTLRHETSGEQALDKWMALIAALGGYVLSALGIPLTVSHLLGIARITSVITFLVMAVFSILVLSHSLANGIETLVKGFRGRAFDRHEFSRYRLVAVVVLVLGGVAISWFLALMARREF